MLTWTTVNATSAIPIFPCCEKIVVPFAIPSPNAAHPQQTPISIVIQCNLNHVGPLALNFLDAGNVAANGNRNPIPNAAKDAWIIIHVGTGVRSPIDAAFVLAPTHNVLVGWGVNVV